MTRGCKWEDETFAALFVLPLIKNGEEIRWNIW